MISLYAVYYNAVRGKANTYYWKQEITPLEALELNDLRRNQLLIILKSEGYEINEHGIPLQAQSDDELRIFYLMMRKEKLESIKIESDQRPNVILSTLEKYFGKL